jgi:hypothetical protein
MEDVGTFYGHLVYFMAIWYVIRTLGIFCGNLVYFPRFGTLYQEKSGNPDSSGGKKKKSFFRLKTLTCRFAT